MANARATAERSGYLNQVERRDRIVGAFLWVGLIALLVVLST
jgi:hypothetical protein